MSEDLLFADSFLHGRGSQREDGLLRAQDKEEEGMGRMKPILEARRSLEPRLAAIRDAASEEVVEPMLTRYTPSLEGTCQQGCRGRGHGGFFVTLLKRLFRLDAIPADSDEHLHSCPMPDCSHEFVIRRKEGSSPGPVMTVAFRDLRTEEVFGEGL